VLVGAAVVEHVRPVEGVVTESLRDARGEDPEPVAHFGQEPLEGRQDRRGQFVEHLGQLGGKATGQLRGELGVVGRDRADPLLPLGDERAVDHLPDVERPLHDLADDLPSGVFEVGQQVEDVRAERAEREVVAPGVAVLADGLRLHCADREAGRDVAVPELPGRVVCCFQVDVPAGHIRLRLFGTCVPSRVRGG
jgi:hypothetical protein